nr:hypothetical protein BaRGS_013435 [Batillaria attramentaria]
MPTIGPNERDESWTIDIFDTTPEMPSYLVAFFVSDYNATGTGHINGIRYTTYTQPHREEEGTLGHDTGVLALDWLEKNFAPSFKSYLPKIDSVTVPHFDSGAMENWGMVTYNKDFLYKEGRDAIWKPFWIMETVTHELVHQWFGNIVTPSWWGSLWLSEGFASYWMYYITEELNPTMRDSEIRVAHSVQGVMQVEAVTDMHPLTYDPQTPEEIKAGFDFIEYSKYYLTKNALRSVEYKDLLQDLDEVSLIQG